MLIELIVAVSAVASALFIGMTWDVARKQLTSLNRGTELQNFISLAQEMDSADFSNAFGFILSLKPLSLEDKKKQLDEDSHLDSPKFDRVTNYFERIAFLANHALIDTNIAIAWWGVMVNDVFESIGDYIILLQNTDPGFCSELVSFSSSATLYWQKYGRSSTSAKKIRANGQ